MNKSQIKTGLLWMAAISGTVGSMAGQYVIKEQEKKLEQHKRYARYLEYFAEGLEEIANDPKADPMDNRRAVSELATRLKSEAVLEGLDFEIAEDL